MPNLESIVIMEVKKKIRSLSHQAAIEILLGMVDLLIYNPTIKSVWFTEAIEDGVKLTKAKNNVPV